MTKPGFKFRRSLLWLLPVALLAGCAANAPPGPRVAVMPAPGKPFEQFAAEEQYCRGYAQQSVGGQTPGQSSGQSVAGSAVVGTVIGAAAGAALGGRHGTSTGAGMGLITGTMIGAGQGSYSAADTQRAYDIAYQQCMYAKGNQLPQAYQRQPIRPSYQQPGYPPPNYQPAYPPPPPGSPAPPRY